jgi:small-conductance mechanosensitive channel
MSEQVDQLEQALVGTEITGWDVLWAIVALVAAWILSRLVRRVTRRLLGRVVGLNDDAKRLISQFAGYFVILLGLALAVSLIGGNATPMLIVLVVVGVIITLASKAVAENFVSGLILQTRGTVRLGDEISAMGHSGTVNEMNGRSVVIRTPDGRHVHLPNVELLVGPLANHTSFGTRRSEMEVRFESTNEYDSLTARLAQAVAGCEHVSRDHPVSVDPAKATKTTTELTVRFWHDATDPTLAAVEVHRALTVVLQDLPWFSVGAART